MCSASASGFRFTVDDSKVMQAYADIPSSSFHDFVVTYPDSHVCIDLLVPLPLSFFSETPFTLPSQDEDEDDRKVEFRVQLQLLYDTLRLFGELSGRLALKYSTTDKQLCITCDFPAI